uniref:Shootin-1 n=1 Tax=Heterorhabditis bacteriophora TaxID=37862 RepID=A0A1I7WL26_HETBA
MSCPLSRSTDHVDMVLGESSSPQPTELAENNCSKRYELPPPPPPPLPFPTSDISSVIPPPPPPPPDELMVSLSLMFTSRFMLNLVSAINKSMTICYPTFMRSNYVYIYIILLQLIIYSLKYEVFFLVNASTRGKRMSSELDEDLLRQMLLNQVTSKRKNNQSEIIKTQTLHLKEQELVLLKKLQISIFYLCYLLIGSQIFFSYMIISLLDRMYMQTNEEISKGADVRDNRLLLFFFISTAKRSLLFGLDARLAEKMSYLEEAACTREKLMKSVEELTARINVAYTECNHLMDKREKTRDEVQQYEREKLSRLIDSRH